MPLPERKDESAKDYVERCMSSEEVKKEYPDHDQRLAVCIDKSKAFKSSSTLGQVGDEIFYNEAYELYIDWGEKTEAAEYKGRKVTLNKPFRTPDGPKKFAVYVKNKSGNVIIVRFGDPNMEIKRDNTERRKSFRARHKCDTAKDKTTPRFWSCKMW